MKLASKILKAEKFMPREEIVRTLYKFVSDRAGIEVANYMLTGDFIDRTKRETYFNHMATLILAKIQLSLVGTFEDSMEQIDKNINENSKWEVSIKADYGGVHRYYGMKGIERVIDQVLKDNVENTKSQMIYAKISPYYKP